MLTINLNISNFLDVYAKSKNYKLKKYYEAKDLYKYVKAESKEKLKNILMLNNAYVNLYEIYKKELLIKSKLYTDSDKLDYDKNKDTYIDFMENYKLLVSKERDYIDQKLKTTKLTDKEYMKNKAYLNMLNQFLKIELEDLKKIADEDVLNYYKERYEILTNIANAYRHAQRFYEIRDMIHTPIYSRGLKYHKKNIFEQLDDLSQESDTDERYGELRQLLDLTTANYNVLKSRSLFRKRKTSLLKYTKDLDEAYLKRLYYMENECLDYTTMFVNEELKNDVKNIAGEHNKFRYIRDNTPTAFTHYPQLIEKFDDIARELNKSFLPYHVYNGKLVSNGKKLDKYRHYIYALSTINELASAKGDKYKSVKKYDANCLNLALVDQNEYKLTDFKDDVPSKEDTYLEDLERKYNKEVQKRQEEIDRKNKQQNNTNVAKNNENSVKTQDKSNNNSQKQDNNIKAVDKNLPLDQQIDEYFKGLIGLNEVKNTLLEVIAKKVLEGKNYEQGQMHMAFLGNPGTGKTTVARIVGKILYENGLINSDKVVECKFSDLYQQYVGFSAKATQDKIKEAEGGVLFIDEAHQLAVSGDGQHDYRKEIINVLVPELENNKNLLVIFAGYSKEMTEMLKNSDKGLFSRVNHRINFKDFNKKDIMSLFDLEIKKKKNRNDEKFIVTDKAREYVSNYFDLLIKARDGEFANGREVRTTVNKILNKFGVLALKRKDIRTIDDKTMKSILTSTTFKEEILGNEENPRLVNEWNNFVELLNEKDNVVTVNNLEEESCNK